MTPAEFGATPWGREWVRTIERTAGPPNPLLPRARSLARNHTVTVSVTPGRIDAEVVVARATHRVRIDVPPWPEPTRADVSRLLAEAVQAHGGPAHGGPAHGDLPDALAADLTRRGIAAAVRPDEDTGTCDCRTRRRPCVHVLATVYALAQLVDERPVLTFEARSLDVPPAGPSPDWIPVADLDAAGFYGDRR